MIKEVDGVIYNSGLIGLFMWFTDSSLYSLVTTSCSRARTIFRDYPTTLYFDAFHLVERRHRSWHDPQNMPQHEGHWGQGGQWVMSVQIVFKIVPAMHQPLKCMEISRLICKISLRENFLKCIAIPKLSKPIPRTTSEDKINLSTLSIIRKIIKHYLIHHSPILLVESRTKLFLQE